MTTIYKVYDPENEALIFTSLRSIKLFLSLSDEDIKNIFNQGVHTISTGDVVITYKD